MASAAFESMTIAGRRFTCKADDSPTILFPGFTNESMVQGDGAVKYKKTRHTGHITGVNVDIDDARGDQEYLQELQSKTETFAITATLVDGTVISGDVQLIDELERDASENTIELNLEGIIEKL